MGGKEQESLPSLALIGAGIFVRSQYVPRLKEIAHTMVLRTVWSRTQESARRIQVMAQEFAPTIDCKWGDEGLEEIVQDKTIQGVFIVLAAQAQVDVSLKMLRAGKHVLQEKPAANSVSEAESSLAIYNSLCSSLPRKPIWGLAENYRFEPAFLQARDLVKDLGDIMSVQVIFEASMNSSNPYFSSSWRRNFMGGFILDMGVHAIAGLRMVIGCEVVAVSAVYRHIDSALPPPDHITALLQLQNGCAGIFIMSVASVSPKISWRVVGSKGIVETERSIKDSRHGYLVSLQPAGRESQRTFHPFSGVNEELKAFVNDISEIESKQQKGEEGYEPEPRSSFTEGAQDVAILEAMLESGKNQGALIPVKRFLL